MNFEIFTRKKMLGRYIWDSTIRRKIRVVSHGTTPCRLSYDIQSRASGLLSIINVYVLIRWFSFGRLTQNLISFKRIRIIYHLGEIYLDTFTPNMSNTLSERDYV